MTVVPPRQLSVTAVSAISACTGTNVDTLAIANFDGHSGVSTTRQPLGYGYALWVSLVDAWEAFS